MKRYLLRGLGAVFCLIFSQLSWSNPANPDPFEVLQPDGSRINVVQRGDERQNWVETTDGFTIARHKTSKVWYYASGFLNDKAILTRIKVNGKPPLGLRKHIRPTRSQGSTSLVISKDGTTSGTTNKGNLTTQTHVAPASFTKGHYQGAILMILVDFPDFKATVSTSHYVDLLNQSIDFYRANSMGQANLVPAQETSGTANDGVIGWLTMSQNHPNTNSPYILGDVVAVADPYINFADYDTDGDGHVMSYELSIVIVTSGYDMSSGGTASPAIWPHAMFTVPNGPVIADGVNIGNDQNTPFGSGYTGGYCMIGEQQGVSNTNAHPTTVGVLVHEMGHSLFGITDLYDSRRTGLGGIGRFGVMGSGSWGMKLGDTYGGQTPSMMSAYSRERLLWAVPLQGSGQHMLTAVTDSGATVSNTVYKATPDGAPNSEEYFLIENRQSIGYDRGMVALSSFGGLVIWHVDNTKPGTYNNPPSVDVEEANRPNDAFMDGVNTTDFWYSGNAATFDDTSTPNSKLWSGAASGVNINNISASGTVMSFTAGSGGGVTSPTANPGGPYSGIVNQTINFSGAGSSDPNGLTLSYQWDFGDGNVATGMNVSHAYSAAGTYTVSLTVNNGSLSASASTSATVTTGGGNPVSDPGGPYSGSTGNPIQFDGTGSSDPNGLTLSYVWVFGDNSPNQAGATTSHVYTQAGTYNLTLWVSNGSGWYSNSTSVTVTDTVTKPTANPGGPYSGFVNQAISFNGSGSSDPNGLALSYTWYFGDGGTATGVSPNHTYTQAGTYNVNLIVSNGTVSSDYVATTVTVSDARVTPVPNAGGPYSGSVNQLISFNGSGSYDPAGNALQYVWIFGDGSPSVQGSPFATHSYTAAGTYTATLYVNNGTGTGWIADSTTVTVTGSSTPVAIAGGPYSGVVGQSILLNGSSSYDPAGLPLSYVWNFGDNTPNVAGVAAYHSYAAAGTYTVTLYVSNGGSWVSSQTTVTVSAANNNPVAIPGGPYYATVNQPVLLSGANSYDPNGLYLSNYVWRFDDATPNQGGMYTYHTFTTTGTHTVELWVYNGLTWGWAQATVYVSF